MVRKILHLQINLVLWLFFSSNFSLFYGEIELRNFRDRVSPPVSRFSSIEVSGSLLIDISWIFFFGSSFNSLCIDTSTVFLVKEIVYCTISNILGAKDYYFISGKLLYPYFSYIC